MDRPRPTNCVRNLARQPTSAPGRRGEGAEWDWHHPTLDTERQPSSGWLDGVVNCLHAAHAVLEDERVDGVLRLAAASDR